MHAIENILIHLTKPQMLAICENAGLSCHTHEFDSSIRDRIQGALRRDEVPAHVILAAWDGVYRAVVPEKRGQ